MDAEESIVASRYDVAILGGGLAGLSCALQLRKLLPNCSITVLEKNAHPVPEAAHKVGESTVELAAHYFANVLGLTEHLKRDQLPKLGLRFFFGAGDNRSIAERLELGAVDFPPTGSYQLDRGRFENFLGALCREERIHFIDQARVKEIQLSSDAPSEADLHQVHYSTNGELRTLAARWIVDASGRAGVLKHKLGLAKESPHKANAVWFRLDAKVNLDEWSDDPKFVRFTGGALTRWLSTNHLMGPGYWVWIIPLASGSTSVGIVADADMHPLPSYNSFEKALNWLERYEPQCAAAVARHRDKVQDFKALKHYSHDCQQVFSARRWALTGEAGVFLDPFYSPGSDFIAMSNTFICDLIRRDLEGLPLLPHLPFYNDLYLSFFRNTSLIFEGQYPIWGNNQIMPLKIVWDFATYWAFMAFLFYQERLCRFDEFREIRSTLERIGALNVRMQQFFREWHSEDRPVEIEGLVDLFSIESVRALNVGLSKPLEDGECYRQLERNAEILEELADEMIAQARRTGRYTGPIMPEHSRTTAHLAQFFLGIGL